MLVEPSDHPPNPVPLGTEPDGAMPRCRDTQGDDTQGVALGWGTLPLQGEGLTAIVTGIHTGITGDRKGRPYSRRNIRHRP
jgi:hypothetical protein